MCGGCEILVGSNEIIGVRDEEGCVLKAGHSGPHEFVDQRGRRWHWETDWACDCEYCMTLEGDYCITYWEKRD